MIRPAAVGCNRWLDRDGTPCMSKRHIHILQIGNIHEIDDLRGTHSEHKFGHFCGGSTTGRTTVAHSVSSATIGVDSCDRLGQRLRDSDVFGLCQHFAKSPSFHA